MRFRPRFAQKITTGVTSLDWLFKLVQLHLISQFGAKGHCPRGATVASLQYHAAHWAVLLHFDPKHVWLSVVQVRLLITYTYAQFFKKDRQPKLVTAKRKK